MKNFKKGAASFYVVAFSTLILLIVVASFTALVVAQITRSSNDDLSQSAYDSALAGIEDAKLAYYNYQSCVVQGVAPKKPADGKASGFDCSEIVWMVENASDDCDVVAKVLGRNYKDEEGNLVGVSIDEVKGKNNSDNRNNMQQSYTCAKIQTSLKDYRSSVSSANPMKVVKVKLDNMGRSDVNANAVKKVKLSWGSDLNNADVQLSNFSDGRVEYPQIKGNVKAANPPTIAFTLVQAEAEFDMSSFDLAEKNGSDYRTNRGMIYLTPVAANASLTSTSGKDKNYNGTAFGWDEDAQMKVNKIGADKIVDSNNAAVENYAYGVNCPDAGTEQFACAAMIDLPKPIESSGDGITVRSDDNFIVVVSLPYGSSTDFMLEFFCGDVMCGKEKVFCEDGDTACVAEKETKQVNLKGMQIGVDSTGKANDLFRRVDTRLEGASDFAISIMGPLELYGDSDEGGSGGGTALEKDHSSPVTCEWNFSPTTCN